MPTFSTASLRKLATLHPDLQRVLRAALATGPDFTIVSAARTPEEQERLVHVGFSRTLHSKHLLRPSEAVDIAPYPVDWNDSQRFHVLAGYVMGVASQLGVTLRWGGDWNRNWRYEDQHFNDWGHLELVKDAP